MSDTPIGNIEIIDEKPTENLPVNETLPPALSGTDALVAKAVDSGNIEMLEKLLDLQDRVQDRMAKEEFNRHFSQMQGDFVAVKKSAENKHLHSKYAKIEDMQAAYTPVISRHGFSYSWREEALEGGAKRTILEITGYNHTRETSFDVPKLEAIKSNSGGGAVQNAIQVAGAMSTYGRRYTFIAGFGVIMEGEDSDGSVNGIGVEFADDVLSLQACGSIAELQASWSTIFPKVRNNKAGMNYLSGIFRECKEKLA